MKLSVVISTYNSPDWLEKVIWGYYNQSYKDFEIVIADDGSGEDTKKRIDQLRKETELNIKHVWHEDKGFRKTIILNKAVLQTTTDYLLFTDGDCIPRSDFVATHVKFANKGFILSGGYFKLPMETSKAIRKSDIISGNCFEKKWLMDHALRNSYKTMKLTAKGKWANLLNKLTPTRATWNGHNASGWKDSIISVNGYDERMQYGGEDRELGERLSNLGIKSRQIRYSAICIHLDHVRGYVTKEALKKNVEIRRETKSKKAIWTEYGIYKKGKYEKERS